MPRILKTNTAVRLSVGPFIDKADFFTLKTGMTVTNLAMNMWHEHDDGSAPYKSIDAVAFTASAGDNDMAELAGGYYDIEITAAQVNFIGRAKFLIYDDDVILPYFEEWLVVPANVFDSIMGTDKLDVNAAELGGTSQTGNDVGADVNDILADTGTDGVIVASIANDAITAAAIKTDAITEIQNGLALEATLTAIKGAGWSTETLAAIDVLIDAIKAKTDTIPASPAAVGSAMTLADDAITSAKFDESTAFPLKSADTGSTKVARTGADSDTLETLSDQIDTIDSSGVASAVDTLLSTNHGSGAWGSAGNGGSLTLTYTVSKSTGGVLEGATVKLYSDSNRTTLVNTKISNVLGQVIFTNLVAGTYYLTTTCSGYEDMLDSEVVA